MDESKIRFRNEPFIARVTFKKNEVLTCIPVVYDEKLRCGVGILFEDSPGTYWGYVMPRNFIAAWRGTEVLRRLNVLKDETLCYAFHAGLRNPCESDMESRVKPMIVQIGQKAYDEIMSLPVPEPIIRAILDNQKSDPPPDLSPITDEVRAGTIQWRQEFADAGVKHPDEVDAEKRKQEETIATFKRELVSYAKSMHLPRKGLAMGNVENSLLFLIESGASDIPNLELVALAGVMGQLTISCMATAMVCGSSSRE
ncbi:MAG: hypothetical protein NTY93_02040, partial [Candidatus Kaiserbacteria bacterium]|nr:hypothetical protein [Candidatus Kaiserbacteria bacterium]